MKYYLLTGADGYLGGKMAKKIVDSTECGVIAVSSFPERIPSMIERERIKHTERIIILSSEEMFKTDLRSKNVIGVVHFAFSRAIFPSKDIANSLDYSLRAFHKMIDSEISNCIYISSQSVYGDTSEIRYETTAPAPNSIYAMAKYAGEKLFESCYYGHSNLAHTILRLDNVIQSQNLVNALCRKAKQGENLSLTGGKQVFSYIDVSDVPDAIYSMLTLNREWAELYNVGPNEMRVSLIEIAETVRRVAGKYGITIDIELKPDDTELWAGMNTTRFLDDTGWKPRMTLDEMVEKIYLSI